MALIDIIVPVYNISSDELFSCLAGLACQTIADSMRITIVNDGGVDDNYAQAIRQIGEREVQLITLNNNAGPGVARQQGLDNTDCEYLLFLDADDAFVDEFAVESLYEALVNNSEAVMSCGLCVQNRFDEVKIAQGYAMNSLHGKMYRRSFLNQYNIHFSSQYSYAHEDNGFNTACILSAQGAEKVIEYIEKPIYLYTFNPEGLSHNIASNIFVDSFVGNILDAQLNAIQQIGYHPSIAFNIVENMVQLYYFYVEALYTQSQELIDLWTTNCKKYYTTIFKDVALTASKEMLIGVYNMKTGRIYSEMYNLPFIPKISFIDFLNLIVYNEDNEESNIIMEKFL